MKSEKGAMLIEVMVAMALLGIIGVTLLSGTATTSTARMTAEERSTAKILEELKTQEYDTSYDYTVPPEFTGYSVNLTVENILANNLQRVTAAIEHRGKVVLTLESYKSNR
jgi:type II secretory pathway pseudopilin PulG